MVENTADIVDFAASGILLGAALALSTNPVGLSLVVVGGVVYGIARLAGGKQIDIWINDKFGYDCIRFYLFLFIAHCTL